MDFLALYHQGFGFPEWTLNQPRSTQVRVLADVNDRLSVLHKLVTEREPVNIAMKRYYAKKKLKAHFGYQKSYYSRYYKKHGTLAPNISLYTPITYRLPELKKIFRCMF